MTSVAIYYFSGTGNTEIVSELLANALEERGASVDLVRMEDALQDAASISVAAHDLIGVAHPVHGFDVPRIVYTFVDALPPGQETPTFVFKTAGGLEDINDNASASAIARLRRKGYDAFYDRLFCMASNWLVRTEDALAKRLYTAAVAKTAHMSEEVLAGEEREMRAGLLSAALAKAVSVGEAFGGRAFGRLLRVTDACIDCNTCIENCPVQNIRRQDGEITFGWDCLWCMRCIYGCPTQAISPRFMRFCVLKEGYHIRDLIADPGVDEDTIAWGKTDYSWKMKHYLQNVEV